MGGHSGGISRRRFLGATAGVGLSIAASGSVARALGGPGPVLLRQRAVQLPGPAFTLGIASGDPLPNSVILWTRLATDLLAPDGGLGADPVPVRWEVAADERFKKLVKKGRATATPDDGFSVHADAKGLEPGRDYFYRFHAGDETSPVGRTRTAPARGANEDRVRFAIASCQNYQDGYFTPHHHLAEEDLDFVAFLGDYIYEGGVSASAPRQHEGPEPTDLAAYRARYARYKSDVDLQVAHAAFPWIVTWDDHEVENNYATDRAQNDTLSPAQFLERRAAAYKAWWEHQPVRLGVPDGPEFRIYRSLAYGRLAQVDVLDTRQYRTNQPCNSPIDIAVACEDTRSPDATLLGTEQEEWLARSLRTSEARWNVVAQQVMVGRMNFVPGGTDPAFNVDQWDGYGAAQQRLMDTLANESKGNSVVVTGDIHSSWVNDLKATPSDDTSDTIATEFVGTSITSSMDLSRVIEPSIPQNPSVKYYEGERRGYAVCELTKDRWRTDYRYVSTVDAPTATIETAVSFVVDHGRPGAQEA